VDRLVDDLKKADDIRKKRVKKADDEDITYINDKNKQFNQKLARYYNKVWSIVLYVHHVLDILTGRIVHNRDQRQFRARHDDMIFIHPTFAS